MSIFFMRNIASIARLAFSDLWSLSMSISAVGTTCHESRLPSSSYFVRFCRLGRRNLSLCRDVNIFRVVFVVAVAIVPGTRQGVLRRRWREAAR